MSSVVIERSPLSGELTLPPSKSIMHRAIICAALAAGESRVSPVIFSDDILRTIDAVRALGAEVDMLDGAVAVRGITSPAERADINCGESGSTLRFIMPVAAALGTTASFTGSGMLPSRPLGVFYDVMPPHGAAMSSSHLPLTVSGQLRSGTYTVDGGVSSQFITGLMFALPLLSGSSTIRLSSPLQSASYVNITLSVLRSFGVNILQRGSEYIIPGRQRYRPHDYISEGDWSHSAFFITAAMAGGEIRLRGLKKVSPQGDSAVFDIARRMGADLSFDGDTLVCRKKRSSGITIDASDIPDLVPAIAAAAALAGGRTNIINAGRLRIKECDRLAAMSQGLAALGAEVAESADALVIKGGGELHGGSIDGHGDHRIVMAFACLASCIGNVTISCAEAVSKSYPGFFDDFKKLGGKYHVI